jgi:hypothetical protein
MPAILFQAYLLTDIVIKLLLLIEIKKLVILKSQCYE